MMLLRCTSTVLGEMLSNRAIDFVISPAATYSRICRSRGVSDATHASTSARSACDRRHVFVPGQGFFDAPLQSLAIQRKLDAVDGPVVHCRHGRGDVVITRQIDERLLAALGAQLFLEEQTAASGDLLIEHEAARHVGCAKIQCVVGRGKPTHRETSTG